MPRRIFGWHTPDEYEEADISCRPLLVPVPFIPVVGGALAELTNVYNWEQVGTMTPQRATEIMTAMLSAWEEDCMDCQTILNCLYNAEQMVRMNTETGRLEVSSDGGETWTESTANDPRFSGSRMAVDSEFDCEDVQFIVGMIQRMIADYTAQINLGAGILGAIGALHGVLALLFSFSPVGVIAIGVMSALSAFTTEAIEAALTPAVWERLLCNLYCNLQDKTSISTATFDEILVQVTDDESGIAETVLWNLINSLGPVGLQNAFTMRIAPTNTPADCENCPCVEWEVAWLSGDGNAFMTAPANVSDGNAAASYQAVEDRYRAPQAGTQPVRIGVVDLTSPTVPFTVTYIEMTFNVGTWGNGAPRVQYIDKIDAGVTTTLEQVETTTGWAENQTLIWEGSETVEKLRFRWSRAGTDNQAYLLKVVVRGAGVNPFV